MSGFVVYEWMLGRGLGLKGCELLIFGLVVSYSRKGKVLFESEKSLSDYTWYSKRSIRTALKNLVAQGLIVRSDTQHPKYQTFEYTISDDVRGNYFPGGEENSSSVQGKKLPQEQGNNFTTKEEESSPNSIRHSPIHNSIYKEQPTRVKTQNRYGTSDQRHAVLTVGHPEDFAEPDRV